jgi:hypothetical protein
MVTSRQALVIAKMVTALDRSPGFVNPCSFFGAISVATIICRFR